MGKRNKKSTFATPETDKLEKLEKKKAQDELANTIKGLHWHLRKQFKAHEGDYESVWKQHSTDVDSLKQYATAMHALATDYWEALGDTRIHWCRNTATQYFYGDGLRLALEKDERRQAFFQKAKAEQEKTSMVVDQCSSQSTMPEKWPTSFESKVTHASRNLSTTQTTDGNPLDQSLLHYMSEKDKSENKATPSDGLSSEHSTTSVPCPEQTNKETERGFGDLPVRKDNVTCLDANISTRDPLQFSKLPRDKSALKNEMDLTTSKACGSSEHSPDGGVCSIEDCDLKALSVNHPFKGKIRLLDVGSCYNPFQHFEEFEPFPIDLCPATPDVYQCDFLQLKVCSSPEGQHSTSTQPRKEPYTNPRGTNSTTNDFTVIETSSSKPALRNTAFSVDPLTSSAANDSICAHTAEPKVNHTELPSDHTVRDLKCNDSAIGPFPNNAADIDSVQLDTISHESRDNQTNAFPNRGVCSNDHAKSEVDLATNNVSVIDMTHRNRSSHESSDNQTNAFPNSGVCINVEAESEEYVDPTANKANVIYSTPVNTISDKHSASPNGVACRKVTSLPANSFQCVVFSLLLEYLPACQQRLQCCVRAHQLLALNGLLIIITPDSHSQHRNAPMMKSWKEAIEALGFRRWKYEKQCHLHGMAFRKVTKDLSVCESDFSSLASKLYIPQDFKDEPDQPPPPKKKKGNAISTGKDKS